MGEVGWCEGDHIHEAFDRATAEKRKEVKRQETERKRRVEALKAFARWVFRECVSDWRDLRCEDARAKMKFLGLTVTSPARLGSQEADEWGEGAELHFLAPWLEEGSEP